MYFGSILFRLPFNIKHKDYKIISYRVLKNFELVFKPLWPFYCNLNETNEMKFGQKIFLLYDRLPIRNQTDCTFFKSREFVNEFFGHSLKLQKGKYFSVVTPVLHVCFLRVSTLHCVRYVIDTHIFFSFWVHIIAYIVQCLSNESYRF